MVEAAHQIPETERVVFDHQNGERSDGMLKFRNAWERFVMPGVFDGVAKESSGR